MVTPLITMSLTGLLFLPATGAASIASSVAHPSMTRPMTQYWPSRLQQQGTAGGREGEEV